MRSIEGSGGARGMHGPCCLQRAWKAMSLRGCERKLTSACDNASFLDEFHAPFLQPCVAHGLLFKGALTAVMA